MFFKRTFLIIAINLMLLVPLSVSADELFIGDPMPMLEEAEHRVRSEYPDSKLVLISTFGNGTPDNQCSLIGWQFIFSSGDWDDITIRDSFRHKYQNLECRYVSDDDLDVENSAIFGYSPIQNRLNQVKIGFPEALSIAKSTVKNGFSPRWAKLATPLHPLTAGKVLYIFLGPVRCNKGASISINAENGNVLQQFTKIPICP